MDIENYIQLRDESNDRKYFSLLPHYILNHSTAIDQALYMQMKRYAGESPGGLCWASKATLREKLGVGKIALNKSLEYLVKRGWIIYKGKKKVETKGGEQEVDVYAVSDIWKQNIEYYETNIKGGLKQHTLPKGGSENVSKGGLESSKGGSETDANKNHMNKNHLNKKEEKNILEQIEDMKQASNRGQHSEAKEKLIYRFISRRLVFAYDDKQSLTLNSANVVIPKIENYPMKMIAALFNSSLYQFLFQKKFSTIKVLRGHLEQLPLPQLDDDAVERIVKLVDSIIHQNRDSSELDQFILDIFGLTEAEKEYIINFNQ